MFETGSQVHGVPPLPAFMLYYFLWPGKWHMITTTGKKDLKVLLELDGVHARVDQLMAAFQVSNAMRTMPRKCKNIRQVSCESFVAWVVYCSPAILIRALDDCGHSEAAYMWR